MNASDAAQPGDVLALGKPLGIGVCSAVPKRDGLSAQGCTAMLAGTAGPPRIVAR